VCLALHIWSEIEAGKVAISDGPVMAGTDDFRCVIRGKGGHGAMPHQAIDPVIVAAHVVTALQSVVSRSIPPTASGVVTVGKLQAGTAFNIIPDTAFLEGTVRAFEEPVRALLETRVREICETLPQAWGASAEFSYTRGFPATVSTPEVCDVVRAAAAKVVGAENVIPFEPTMGAEDFSQVLERVPGCYFFVGGRNAEIGATWPHHHPKFNICESALMIGARTLTESVKACLES
jgi:amidohydrolase